MSYVDFYAGFWRRVAAAIIDQIILAAGGFVFGFIYGACMMIERGTDDPSLMDAKLMIYSLILTWVYFAGMESSRPQGALGKMLLRIKVTDLEGKRISFGVATLRHLCKILSAIILLIGFIVVAFTRKKQGLHDVLAECLVVNK